MSQLASVGDFCPNPTCSDYEKCQEASSRRNIIKFGYTTAGKQRYKCHTCGKTFTETYGTLFYRRRVCDSEILEVLAMIAEGSRISSVHRIKGYSENTITAWLADAADQIEAVEAVLLADYSLSRAQLDGLWFYVAHNDKKKGIRTPG